MLDLRLSCRLNIINFRFRLRIICLEEALTLYIKYALSVLFITRATKKVPENSHILIIIDTRCISADAVLNLPFKKCAPFIRLRAVDEVLFSCNLYLKCVMCVR